MPIATITLRVIVALEIAQELAAEVTRDDLVSMARGAIPSSMTTPDPTTGRGGPLDGVQVEVEGVCQEEDGEPVFADVTIEHDICTEPEIEFETDGFTKAELE